MAGSTDAPDNKSPDAIIAQGLIGTDSSTPPADPSGALHESAYGTPSQPNADKPGAPAAKPDAQAGGAQAPPGDKPAVVASAAPGDAHAATPAATSDKAPTKDALTPPPAALDVMHKVDGILDGDVPRLNKAHDLAGAQKAYERAIALSQTITPQDLATAQQELAQVRKDLKHDSDPAAKSDPATVRNLANKEADLYTITRLKDAALGNMALWYYRQGKTEDGNARLLEACDVDPNTATKMQKMDPQEENALVSMLVKAPAIPPILGDSNFFKQLTKITQSGEPVPPVFDQLYKAIHAHNQKADQGADAGSTHAAGADAGAAAGADTQANSQPANYDVAKNKVVQQKFDDLVKSLKDKPGPLTDAQRTDLEAGIKSYDAKNLFVGNALIASQQALDKVLPKDKQQAYSTATNAVDTDLQKIAAANKGSLPADVQTKIKAAVNAANPTDFEAAANDLAKSNPDLSKDLKAAVAVLPTGAAGMNAMKLYAQNSELQSIFTNTSEDQIEAHYEYAKILTGTKNPPDPADMAHAKDVLISGFQNVPPSLGEKVWQGDPAVTALRTTLGLVDKPAAGSDHSGTPAAAPGGDHAGTPAAAGSDHAGTPAAAAGDTALAGLSSDQLQTKLLAAEQQGPAGMKDVKDIYGALFKMVDDPAAKKAATDALNANLPLLESGKDPKGQPIDDATRMKLQLQDLQCVSFLSLSAQLHSNYAMYLGDKRLQINHQDRTSIDDPSKAVAQLPDSLNQLKSMDAQQRLAIAAADKVDINLLKRVDTTINADLRAGKGDANLLAKYQIVMEQGYRDKDGNENLSLLNMRVQTRDQLATLYLMQGRQPDSTGSLTGTVESSLGISQGQPTDALFKPQDALQLLTEAKAANAAINGKDSHDATTETLYAFGQTQQPDVFKNHSNDLKQSGASMMSDMAAMGGSVLGSTLFKFAAAAGVEALGRGEINPVLLNGIGDAGAVTSGVLIRHLAYGALSGTKDKWADSIVHGTAAAMVPIGIRYASQALAGSKVASNILDARASNLTTEGVIRRAAGVIDPDGTATFAQVGKALRESGLGDKAAPIEALGAKPINLATPDDWAAVKTVDLGRSERLALMGGKLFTASKEGALDLQTAADVQGRGVNNFGDLRAAQQKVVDHIDNVNKDVSALGLNNATPIRDALRKAYPDLTKEQLDAEESSLYNSKTVGGLRKLAANPPDILAQFKGMPDETTLQEAVEGGQPIGAAGRASIKEVIPGVQFGPEVGAEAKQGFIRKIGSGVASKFQGFPLRTKVDLGVSFPGEADATQTGLKGFISNTANRLKPSFSTPSVSFPNLEKLNAAQSTPEQFATALNQSQYARAAISAAAGLGAYNSVTGVYDNWWKGKQYQDAEGQWHKESFVDALERANFGDGGVGGVLSGTVGQALIGGFFLKGALPAVLEGSTTAANPGWLAQKIPALGAGSDAVAGSSKQIMTFAKYGALYNSYTVPGYLKWSQGNQDLDIYRSTQKPLQDYSPDDVGTAADDLPQTPAADATTPALKPTAPTNAGADQPAPAAAPAATRPAAPGPAPGQSSIGGDLPPPGSS